jgi:hypothetical protein
VLGRLQRAGAWIGAELEIEGGTVATFLLSRSEFLKRTQIKAGAQRSRLIFLSQGAEYNRGRSFFSKIVSNLHHAESEIWLPNINPPVTS